MRPAALLASLLLAAPAGATDHRFETASGVPVILVEHHGLPFVNLQLHFQVGPAFDPPGKEGLTNLTNRMFMRGTRRLARAELEEAIESLGTEFGTGTQHHAVSVGGSVLTRNLPAFAALLTEIVTQPRFDPEELEKVKREIASEIQADRDDDSVLAARWFRRLVFAGHPFGHPAAGTTRSVAAITLGDVEAHYRRYYGRANLVVAASGATDPDTLRGLLEPGLAALPEGEATRWSFPEVPTGQGRRIALVDKADRSQVQLIVGHPGIPAADPDSFALEIATTAFGGTFTARLMEEVRVKRGWSYGAYARLGMERAGGYYLLQAAPSTGYAADTVALVLSEYEKFVREGLRDDEIEFARGYLLNAFPFRVETPALRAAQIVQARLLGRPDDFVDTYPARIREVTADQVRDAVRRRLDPDNLLVVAVCTAPPLRDAMAALPGVASVSLHPYSDE